MRELWPEVGWWGGRGRAPAVGWGGRGWLGSGSSHTRSTPGQHAPTFRHTPAQENNKAVFGIPISLVGQGNSVRTLTHGSKIRNSSIFKRKRLNGRGRQPKNIKTMQKTPLRVLSKTKDIIPVRYRTYFPNQCSGSFTFWYGSGTLFQTDEILGNPCQFG